MEIIQLLMALKPPSACHLLKACRTFIGMHPATQFSKAGGPIQEDGGQFVAWGKTEVPTLDSEQIRSLGEKK